jgi:ubiquinone/menaquinone biosynthesis C-methylase UbiE
VWATALQGSKILEIGAGTGLNMAYYCPAAAVFALDPAAEMLDRAACRSRKAGLHAQFIRGRAEALPFPEAAFDAAVATLVFCTVEEQNRSLGELYRVVKPKAPVRLFEHIRLEKGIAARLQDLLTPPWKKIAGGCRLNRNTPAAVENAGFHIEHLRKIGGGIFVAIDALKP